MDKEMDKKKLAQALLKVIDPSVLEDDELLVEYLDILQAKISEEKSIRVKQVQEVEGKLEEQLEQTTEISPAEDTESTATYVVMDGDWKKVASILLK